MGWVCVVRLQSFHCLTHKSQRASRKGITTKVPALPPPRFLPILANETLTWPQHVNLVLRVIWISSFLSISPDSQWLSSSYTSQSSNPAPPKVSLIQFPRAPHFSPTFAHTECVILVRCLLIFVAFCCWRCCFVNIDLPSLMSTWRSKEKPKNEPNSLPLMTTGRYVFNEFRSGKLSSGFVQEMNLHIKDIDWSFNADWASYRSSALCVSRTFLRIFHEFDNVEHLQEGNSFSEAK